MRRAAIAALVALLLAGCGVVTRVEQAAPQPAGPDGPGGPMLVLEVVNRSPRDVDLSYTFTAPDSGGEGMGTFAACEAGTMPFGPVLGAFDVAIDGSSVYEGDVPMAARDGYVIVPVSIAASGDATAAGAPRWTAIEPVHRTTSIPGCG
jgi:hypothetical protein